MARERPRDMNLHVSEFHVGHSGLGSTEMREERLEVNYLYMPFSLPSSAASAELCFRRTQEQWRLLPLVFIKNLVLDKLYVFSEPQLPPL